MMQAANTDLMQALHFTADDLAANRQGRLTPAQQASLRAQMVQGSRAVLVIAGLVILVVIGVCIWVVLGSQGIVPAPEQFNRSNAPMILIVMGLVLVFYVIMLARSLRLSRQMSAGEAKVHALTGKIKIKTQRLNNYSAAGTIANVAGVATVSQIVQVGREKIYTTDARVAQAFREGVTYRVYVVGRKPGYIIVSAEVTKTT